MSIVPVVHLREVHSRAVTFSQPKTAVPTDDTARLIFKPY